MRVARCFAVDQHGAGVALGRSRDRLDGSDQNITVAPEHRSRPFLSLAESKTAAALSPALEQTCTEVYHARARVAPSIETGVYSEPGTGPRKERGSMAHPWHHAMRSARRYGGIPEDYLETHTWFDYTKSHLADCRHRLFLHNAWGIFVAERILGALLARRSDSQSVPLRPILEQHILEDFGKIPTLASCLAQLPPEEGDPGVTVYEQCQVSAARWGGGWSDYQDIHRFRSEEHTSE